MAIRRSSSGALTACLPRARLKGTRRTTVLTGRAGDAVAGKRGFQHRPRWSWWRGGRGRRGSGDEGAAMQRSDRNMCSTGESQSREEMERGFENWCDQHTRTATKKRTQGLQGRCTHSSYVRRE